MISYMINNGLMFSGIYRGFIIKRDDYRVYLPGLMNNNIFEEDGTLDETKYSKIKEALPVPTFSSIAVKSLIDTEPTPCWIVFENSDLTKPVVMSFFGKGVKSVQGVINGSGNINTGGNAGLNAGTNTGMGSGANIDGDKVAFLFDGNGLPQSESEMKQYLQTVTVNINDKNGNRKTMKLTVHKKLANDVINIFNEIAETGFRILSSETGAYNWRMNTSGTARSQHSYGTCIDINWNYNPYYANPNTPNLKSEYAITQEVVNIFAKYKWSWGGNWNSLKDYMHFSYIGG